MIEELADDDVVEDEDDDEEESKKLLATSTRGRAGRERLVGCSKTDTSSRPLEAWATVTGWRKQASQARFSTGTLPLKV